MRKSPIPPSLPLIFPFLEGNYKYLHKGTAGKSSSFIYQSLCYFSSVFSYHALKLYPCSIPGDTGMILQSCHSKGKAINHPQPNPISPSDYSTAFQVTITFLLPPFHPMETFHRLESCHEFPPQDLVSPVLNQHALGALAFPDIPLWQ